jgi:hypothetical protein
MYDAGPFVSAANGSVYFEAYMLSLFAIINSKY